MPRSAWPPTSRSAPCLAFLHGYLQPFPTVGTSSFHCVSSFALEIENTKLEGLDSREIGCSWRLTNLLCGLRRQDLTDLIGKLLVSIGVQNTATLTLHNSRPLPPVKDVVKAHEKFKRKFRRALKSGHEAIKIAKTEDELKQQIEDIRSWDSIRGGALESLDEASKARETHQDQRKYGGKRIGRGAQEFVSGFAQFLGAYSSILDIVRGAGGPYGEVGYQTLSILLIVCRSCHLLEGCSKGFIGCC